jgi:hypothetical protein
MFVCYTHLIVSVRSQFNPHVRLAMSEVQNRLERFFTHPAMPQPITRAYTMVKDVLRRFLQPRHNR